jgi:hypothetical protein
MDHKGAKNWVALQAGLDLIVEPSSLEASPQELIAAAAIHSLLHNYRLLQYAGLDLAPFSPATALNRPDSPFLLLHHNHPCLVSVRVVAVLQENQTLH